MGAYYNEFDAEKAAWLRELIKRNLIAPGDVDERSIKDVAADDLRGYCQCHFFAGVGVWSYAARLAGWPDDRPMWSASTPCPSFSAAGKGLGFSDPRHLWPEVGRLVRELRPAVLFGEQVAAAIGHGWLDLVQADLEAEDYAVGKAVLGACSVGAPHIRQRLFFCAYALRRAGERDAGSLSGAEKAISGARIADGDFTDRSWSGEPVSDGSNSAILGHDGRRAGEAGGGTQQPERSGDAGQRSDSTQRGQPVCGSASGITGHAALADAVGVCDDADQRGRKVRRAESVAGVGCGIGRGAPSSRIGAETAQSSDCFDYHQYPKQSGLEGLAGDGQESRGPGWLPPDEARSAAEAGATRGFWAGCDWWYGRDDKWRPAGPGIQPLAHGASARVVRLRGYGDAISPWVAKEFIEAVRSATE